jgi:NitT/TauT family transport system permease protein
MAKKKDLSKATPWISAIGLFVIWELIVRIFNIPVYILPTPSESIMVGWDFRGAIWMHAVNPLLVGFNSVPKVALVPVLVMWFGIGTVPAIITAFLISFFPIVVNVATGLATLEPELRDVLRSLGATRRDILVKVGFPRAMPYFFASLKVAITLAFVGSVISETVASNLGVGYLMLSASSKFNMPLVFAGLLVIAVMGIAMYELFNIIERRSTKWANRGNPTN